MLTETQANDKVLHQVKIQFGWGQYNYETFWVPKTVERTTKTQIILSNGLRFKKETGSGVGNSGQIESLNNDRGIVNQLEEYKLTKTKLTICNDINNLIRELSRKDKLKPTKVDIDDLRLLRNNLQESLKLFNSHEA